MHNNHYIIELETALKHRANGALFVDVRSPAEFAEATIPGAVNVPILNNDERAEIGTMFKNDGSHIARMRGIDIVSPKIPQLIQQINDVRPNNRRPIVIFCWRGGLRSRAMTAFLQLAGFPAFQLRGGHKEFRRHVVDFFAHATWGRMLVLRGLTGVGKTRILQHLAAQQQPIIDLEGLANHRGSTFGGVGLGDQPSQKMFETLLWEQLQNIPSDKWALTEGESRHIGKLILPLRFFQSLQSETTLWIETSRENRIRVILEDYAVDRLPEEVFVAPIQSLQRRLAPQDIKQMLELLAQKNWHKLVAQLMIKYYDPLYRHTKPETRIDIEVDPFCEDQTSLLRAVERILATANPASQTTS